MRHVKDRTMIPPEVYAASHPGLSNHIFLREPGVHVVVGITTETDRGVLLAFKRASSDADLSEIKLPSGCKITEVGERAEKVSEEVVLADVAPKKKRASRKSASRSS